MLSRFRLDLCCLTASSGESFRLADVVGSNRRCAFQLPGQGEMAAPVLGTFLRWEGTLLVFHLQFARTIDTS